MIHDPDDLAYEIGDYKDSDAVDRLLDAADDLEVTC